MGSIAEERLLGNEAEEEGGGGFSRRIWAEWKKMWRITFPTMVVRVTSFGMLVAAQSFIGHFSELDLAAYAMVQIVCVRFANGILLGMSSATETLCGQAYGAGQYHMLGIYLQRSWLVDLPVATALVPVFVFATPIFRLLGQDEILAKAAGTISLWFIPIIYYFVFSSTIQMYLQAQMKNMIVGWVSAASLGLHLLLSWLFVLRLGLGIPGAMGALVIAAWASVAGQLVYVFGGWCPDTWGGFSVIAFKDLLPVVKLSISSGIMLCLELWYNAVLVLLAGYMKDATVAISAFSICLNISAWEYMVGLGFLCAACVRVSNELGKGDGKAAKFAVKVVVGTSLCVGMVFWILCLALGHNIGYLFSNDPRISDSVSSLAVFLAFSMLLNSVQQVLSGVAVGAGWQGTVAVVNVCSYYMVGVPLGVLLAYVARLRVQGIWIGMLCGVAIQTLALVIIAWRTNWDHQVDKANERLNRWLVKPSGGAIEDIDGPLRHY